MSDLPRAVPWRRTSEWRHVMACLYNDNSVKSRRKGVSYVRIWQHRCGGKVPLSVEVTASLVEVGLPGHCGSGYSIGDAHALGMSIVRFVNGVVDLEQRSMFARSVHTLAALVGLPEWIVDIRHDATHNVMPSIPLLRLAVKHALRWLYDRYWTVQMNAMHDSRASLYRLLKRYRKTRRQQISQEALAKEAASEEIANAGQSVVVVDESNVDGKKRKKQRKGKKSIQSASQSTIAARAAIIRESSSAMAATCKKEITSLLIQMARMVFPNTVVSVLVPLLMQPGMLLGATDSVDVWSPAITFFHEKWPHFRSSLIHAVLNKLTDAEQSGNTNVAQAATNWLLFGGKDGMGISAADDFTDLHALLTGCLKATPCRALPLLATISGVAYPNNEQSQQNMTERLSALVNAKYSTNNETTTCLSLDELEKNINKLISGATNSVSDNTTWTPCHEHNWSLVPLGGLPSCKYPNLDIDVEKDDDEDIANTVSDHIVGEVNRSSLKRTRTHDYENDTTIVDNSMGIAPFAGSLNISLF